MDIWIETFKILMNYGAVGIFSYFYTKNSQRKEKLVNDNYQRLIDNLLESNKDIREDIKSLDITLDSGLKYYDHTLDQVIQELSSTKEEILLMTTQIMQSIIDDRLLSKRLFFDISLLKISYGVASTINIIFEILDINGFTDDSQVDLLRDNILRIMEKQRGLARTEIMTLNFNKDILEAYGEMATVLWDTTIISLKDCIDRIDLEGLKSDKNYRKLKLRLKNRIEEYKEDLIEILKEVLREDRK